MSQKCSANIVSFVCNTFFRTRAEVTSGSGETLWVPTLTCESDCESFTDVWEECMIEIGEDKNAKARFDDAMENLV